MLKLDGATGEVLWSQHYAGSDGLDEAALELDAGAHRLGFDVDNDRTPDLRFDLPSLPAGSIANLFAVTDLGGEVWLQAQLQDGTVAAIAALSESGPSRRVGIRATASMPALA